MAEKSPKVQKLGLRFAVTWFVLVLLCTILPNGILNVAYEVYPPVLLIVAVAFIVISRHLGMSWVKAVVWAILNAVVNLIAAIISSISLFGCAGDVSPSVGITQACTDGSAYVRAILIAIITVTSLMLYLLIRSAHTQRK